ncbi:hypothetical protein B0O80DRAFT_157968 [Mortierella sp. GBAus27b]|nr:hypothetical protein B0O80DRAFT_157968 [Mortierella sp. GBAus27b]
MKDGEKGRRRGVAFANETALLDRAGAKCQKSQSPAPPPHTSVYRSHTYHQIRTTSLRDPLSCVLLSLVPCAVMNRLLGEPTHGLVYSGFRMS